MKATSCAVGPNDPVVLPQGSVKSDWEVELGVVIGSRARYVSEADALKHVAGYCVVNDVSEREYQIERGGTWDKGKGCDTFGPIGPWLVTADEVADPQNLAHVARGQRPPLPERQHQDHDLRRGQLVSYLSRFMTLEPGDLHHHRHAAGRGHGREAEPGVPEAGRRHAPGHRGPGRAAADGARLGPGADRRLRHAP